MNDRTPVATWFAEVVDVGASGWGIIMGVRLHPWIVTIFLLSSVSYKRRKCQVSVTNHCRITGLILKHRGTVLYVHFSTHFFAAFSAVIYVSKKKKLSVILPSSSFLRWVHQRLGRKGVCMCMPLPVNECEGLAVYYDCEGWSAQSLLCLYLVLEVRGCYTQMGRRSLRRHVTHRHRNTWWYNINDARRRNASEKRVIIWHISRWSEMWCGIFLISCTELRTRLLINVQKVCEFRNLMYYVALINGRIEELA